MSSDDPAPEIPSLLRRLSSDEYDAPPYNDPQKAAIDATVQESLDTVRKLRRPLADYWSSRLGTAAGLRALNQAFGVGCYEVPAEATYEPAAADEIFGGDQVVIDVQTHFMADRPSNHKLIPVQMSSYARWGPDWWSGLDGMTFYGFAEYLRCVFLESETAVAIITAPPDDDLGGNFLTNEEMAGTRELFDRLAGTGRLLNHTVVHPTDPGTLERMEGWRDQLDPVGWKVYTLGHRASPESISRGWDRGTAWMLDDERIGIPFLERARQLGVTNICSHKGLSGLVDNGSPRDIGPCAKAFPDLRFIVYHSGFEVEGEEGPFTAETADQGINRLIRTVTDNGLGPGSNVYAELGTTWYCLVKRPIEAAHTLGKLLLAFGEDNIVWGTDSVWYGPTQPVIDAFRSFQIPAELSDRYGYPQLTTQIKTKILSTNAARLYGIDLDATRDAAVHDDLAWAKAALQEYQQHET